MRQLVGVSELSRGELDDHHGEDAHEENQQAAAVGAFALLRRLQWGGAGHGASTGSCSTGTANRGPVGNAHLEIGTLRQEDVGVELFSAAAAHRGWRPRESVAWMRRTADAEVR